MSPKHTEKYKWFPKNRTMSVMSRYRYSWEGTLGNLMEIDQKILICLQFMWRNFIKIMNGCAFWKHSLRCAHHTPSSTLCKHTENIKCHFVLLSAQCLHIVSNSNPPSNLLLFCVFGFLLKTFKTDLFDILLSFKRMWVQFELLLFPWFFAHVQNKVHQKCKQPSNCSSSRKQMK